MTRDYEPSKLVCMVCHPASTTRRIGHAKARLEEEHVEELSGEAHAEDILEEVIAKNLVKEVHAIAQ